MNSYSRRNGLRGFARALCGPLVVAFILSYFGYHIVQGDRGLLAMWELEQRIEAAQQEKLRTQTVRANWEQKVALMAPTQVDRDMLEEQARRLLNFGYKDEIVILFDDAPSKDDDSLTVAYAPHTDRHDGEVH